MRNVDDVDLYEIDESAVERLLDLPTVSLRAHRRAVAASGLVGALVGAVCGLMLAAVWGWSP
jgi:hypothetical protein